MSLPLEPPVLPGVAPLKFVCHMQHQHQSIHVYQCSAQIGPQTPQRLGPLADVPDPAPKHYQRQLLVSKEGLCCCHSSLQAGGVADATWCGEGRHVGWRPTKGGVGDHWHVSVGSAATHKRCSHVDDNWFGILKVCLFRETTDIMSDARIKHCR